MTDKQAKIEALQLACDELDQAFGRFAEVLESTDNPKEHADAYVTFVEAMDVFRQKAGIDGEYQWDEEKEELQWKRRILPR